MIIPARPNPNVSALLSRSKPSNYLEAEFYTLGREALLSALVYLGLKKGDGIIIPAYMCNSTLEPLKAYGFDLIFVDVDQHLRLPTDWLSPLISENQVKALLVVHYFGFTQALDEIVNLCHQHDVKVIADASHNFLSQQSGQNSKSLADVEIFSMRKSLPVRDGGALRFKTYQLRNVADKSCLSWLADAKYLLGRLIEKVLITVGLNIYTGTITRLKNRLRQTHTQEQLATESKPCQPSWGLKKYLGDESYLRKAQQRITKNFTQLSDALIHMGFKLVFDDIEYNVPQACVIYDDKGGLVDYLRQQGVGAWGWPAEEMPEAVANQSEKYPNANHFNKTLVLLPIHQNLTSRQINYMVQVLSKWRK